MEIKRLKDNQIRCALTEEEIIEMGFSIDDIIGNGEVTQKFMQVVLEKVEEQESIDVGHISPMVRAELMPDHSMAITFGGISPEEKKGMLNRIMEMMEELSGRQNEEGVSVSQTQKDALTGKESFLEKGGSAGKRTSMEKDTIPEDAKLALEFSTIDEAVRISKVFLEKEKLPLSSFYKMKNKYYLIMEFEGFAKEEMKQLAFTIVEYGNRRIAETAGIAFIKEHGKCILAKNAVTDLMQL